MFMVIRKGPPLFVPFSLDVLLFMYVCNVFHHCFPTNTQQSTCLPTNTQQPTCLPSC